MRHFPLFHDWKPIKVHHYNDISWGDKVPSTDITWKCKCGAVKQKDFYGGGFITLEELSDK